MLTASVDLSLGLVMSASVNVVEFDFSILMYSVLSDVNISV